MKLLSFQQFSLYENGGGNRILRRLYNGKEAQVVSLIVAGFPSKAPKGDINEIVIAAQPTTRHWMRWYLRDGTIWLRESVLKFWTINRICKAARAINYDVLHVVNHGPFSAALCSDEFYKGKHLWVSFHDHFSTTCSSFTDAEKLWNAADRRLVISNELGAEYQKLFGNKAYKIITDGVETSELSKPSNIKQTPIIIYFAGLLHLDYVALFEVLADALDILSKQGLKFKLILRGTQVIKFLNGRSFEVNYLPTTLNNQELKDELDSAAILYLPIKFVTPDFYRYSLSTKMVGYLGGCGAILYHGPADSAACNILKNADAAVCCNTLKMEDMASSILDLLDNKVALSTNAKQLAAQSFNMTAIQKLFWQE